MGYWTGLFELKYLGAGDTGIPTQSAVRSTWMWPGCDVMDVC